MTSDQEFLAGIARRMLLGDGYVDAGFARSGRGSLIVDVTVPISNDEAHRLTQIFGDGVSVSGPVDDD